MSSSNVPQRMVKERKAFPVSALFRVGYLTTVVLVTIYMVVRILTG